MDGGARTRAGSRRDLRALGLAVAVIAVLGTLAAFQPLTGDQALYADTARRLGRGAVLYRDAWDIKQPGIFVAYLLAGSVGGWSDLWLHLAELIVQLAFAVALFLAARPWFRSAGVALVVPLASIGAYYATIEPLQHGQVESLAGIPLAVALWCAVVPQRRRVPALVVAGIAGGLALTLKLALAPIVVALWLTGVWRRPGWARELAWIGLGAAVPAAACLGYFVRHDEVDLVWRTYVHVGPRTTAVAGRPVARLVDAAGTTALRWALPGVLAGVGVASRGRAGWTRLDVGAALWLALAVPVLLVQHWWLYHFDLVVVPMGWLAARGVEWLVTVPRSPRRTGVIVMVAALLALPMAARVAKSARVVAGHGFGRTVADREAIRSELEPQQRDAAAWAEFVHRRSDPAAGQYALANALLPYRADAPEPVAVHGWSPEQYPPEVWRRLRRGLDRSRPAALALDDFSRRILRARSPATLRLIERLWAPAAEVDGVVFMLLRPGAAPEADQP